MRFASIISIFYATVDKSTNADHMCIEIFICQQLTTMNFLSTLAMFTKIFLFLLWNVIVL